MGPTMRRHIALVLIAAVSACSTVQTVPPAPAEVCTAPGLWAIYARDPTTRAKSALPQPLPPGKAAASGAWKGGAGSVQLGFGAALGPGDVDPILAALALALGIAIAPVAAVVGAGVGAVSAHSEAEIAAAEKSMTNALNTAEPARAMRTLVIALAREQAGRRLYDCGDLDDLGSCRTQSPEPVSTILSITVDPPHFEIEGTIAPDLRPLLSATAKIYRASKAAPTYQRAWVYRGRQNDYFDLAADDAKLFRAELATAERALAAKIVDDLLIGGREEVHASAEQPEGTVWTILPPSSSNPDADCP
jgi:hypothetical protein